MLAGYGPALANYSNTGTPPLGQVLSATEHPDNKRRLLERFAYRRSCGYLRNRSATILPTVALTDLWDLITAAAGEHNGHSAPDKIVVRQYRRLFSVLLFNILVGDCRRL